MTRNSSLDFLEDDPKEVQEGTATYLNDSRVFYALEWMNY